MTPSREWIVALAAVLVAIAMLPLGRGRPASAGTTVEFPITVIPADAVNLACSSAVPFAGAHCAFDGEARMRRPSGDGQTDLPLRPFVTTYFEMVLLSGVFEDPNVAAWLDRERDKGPEARVTLYCQGVTLGKAASVGVRWRARDAFGQQHDVTVGRVLSCRIGE
jgi:hypothetical protein